MATLLWQRDLSSDVDGVKQTYSSWDSCMTEAYCKWPAIIGIIIGSLIVFSLLFCLFRCLCCGMECCFGCLSCFNGCCPSPRRRKQDQGFYQQPQPQPYYQQPPPQPYYQQPYPQYYNPASPMSAGGGYRGPQTAAFEVPKKQAPPANYNEDALPAMPGWDTAMTKHVEEEPEDVEMEKLNHTDAQQESLLPNSDAGRYYGHQQQQYANDDLGTMHTGPYRNYDQHQQFVSSPVSTARNSVYPPTYHTSPTSTVYEPGQQWSRGQQGYAPSLPPSYQTGPPSVVSPGLQQQSFGGIGRKPLQDSWRDV